mmetsp:Transcript_5739/g.20593  ORF Transcript_5739/g.20593 Transcript_5739/m.20593 type:complete len:139 (-) Transcript_5739:2067-2483(-)
MASSLATEASGAEVIAATSFDPAHPSHAVIDEDETTFWSTTGCFPQEVIIKFPAPVFITKVKTMTTNVRNLCVDKCDGASPVSWERVYAVEVGDADGRMQVEATQTPKLSATFLKIRILDGWDDFTTFHRLIVEGSHS